MQVSVYQNGIVIGTAVLKHLDPPMGVAFGPFLPSDHYDRDQHANTIEGHYVGDKGQLLAVRADQHGPLKTASIVIDDWIVPEFRKELTVWFQDGGDFQSLFSTHEDYRAYYAR